MTEVGILKLRRDKGIERLAREISSAARCANRLLRYGDWIIERNDEGEAVGMRWISPVEMQRATEEA